MRRLAVLIAVAVVLAAVGVVAWRDRRDQPNPEATGTATGTSSTGPAATGPTPPLTVYDVIERDIREHGHTKVRALQLFSAQFGQLPEVELPQGAPSDPGGSFEGTESIAELARYYDQLSGDQQRAVDNAMGLDRRSGLIVGSDGSTTPGSVLRSFASPVHRDGFVHLSAGFVSLNDPNDPKSYVPVVTQVNSELAAKTGEPAHPAVGVSVTNDPKNKAAAWSARWDLKGKELGPQPGTCWMTVNAARTASLSDPLLATVITHELFHCYQYRTMGSFSVWANTMPWVSEGEATWAMEQLHPSAGNLVENVTHWLEYATHPDWQLFGARSYDAIGFYSLIGYALGSQEQVWGRLLPAVVKGSDVGSYKSLTAGVEDTVLDDWASSYFRVLGHADWDMIGPGPIPTASSRPPRTGLTVGAGDDYNLGPTGLLVSDLYDISGSAEVIRVILISGHARLADDGFGVDKVLTPMKAVNLCVNGGDCTCPDGSKGASELTERATLPLGFGMNGGLATVLAQVDGYSLNDFCKDPKRKRHPKQPPPSKPAGNPYGPGNPNGPGQPGCKSGTCGSSTADPHLVTFDGLRFDLQSEGEFTLVRSTVDGFEVQARQQPYPESRAVSVNTAVAIGVGGHRLTVSLARNGLELRADGTLVPGGDFELAGATVRTASRERGTGFVVRLDDGTSVWVLPIGGWGTSVQIEVAQSRQGSVEGLLGNANGKQADDLVGMDGAALGERPAESDLYGTLADRWRVTQASSLLDYGPDETTETYTDRSFPDNRLKASDLPDRAEAEAACRDRGVTDPKVLEDCILDLTQTGLITMAESLAVDEAVQHQAADERFRHFGTVLSGEVKAKEQTDSFQLDFDSGDAIFIGGRSETECADGGLDVEVLGPDGKRLADQFGCILGRVDLPQRGRYTFVVNRVAGRVGSYRVPVKLIRPDRIQTAHLGDVLSGEFDEYGQHDIFTFEAGGENAAIAQPDCTGNGIEVKIVGPDGKTVVSAGACSLGPVKLDQRGTYRVVIDAGSTGKGPYKLPLRVV